MTINRSSRNSLNFFLACLLFLLASNATAINCENILKWTASFAYNGGEMVIRNNIAYRAKWWTQGQDPENSSYIVWENMGECDAGTAPTGAPANAFAFINPDGGPGDIKMFWMDNTDNEVSFEIIGHDENGTKIVHLFADANEGIFAETDFNLQACGQIFTFKVRAVFEDGSTTDFSNTARLFTERCQIVVEPPQNIFATINEDSIHLSWTPSTTEGAHYYLYIYRADDQGITKTHQFLPENSHESAFTINKDGVYRFTIKANKINDKEQGESEEIQFNSHNGNNFIFNVLGSLDNCTDTNEWNETTEYNELDFVRHMGVKYYAKQGNTNKEPSGSDEFWGIIGECDSSVACQAPYTPGTIYKVGDLVSNIGNIYACKVSGWCNNPHPAHEPGVGWAWTHVWDLIYENCDAGEN